MGFLKNFGVSMTFTNIKGGFLLFTVLCIGNATAQVPSLSNVTGKFRFKELHLSQLGIFRPETVEIAFTQSDLSGLDLVLGDSLNGRLVQTSLVYAGDIPRDLYLGEIPGSFLSYRVERFSNGVLKFLEVLSVG